MVTISPGSTSRTNCAPMASSAALSDATAQPAGRPASGAGSRPSASGRKPMRVARGDQGAGGEHGEGEGADGPMEGLLHALRPGPPGRVGDQLGQHLGVAGGDELHALLGQVVAQPGGVGQVAVVAEHQLAQVGGGEDRLHVGQRVAAGGRVAGVADGDVGRALRRRRAPAGRASPRRRPGSPAPAACAARGACHRWRRSRPTPGRDAAARAGRRRRGAPPGGPGRGCRPRRTPRAGRGHRRWAAG